ncbi:hypothetical protein [Streptomyces sp. NBC_00272]|uniref:hypothetical protein n=1 Tax=Streptomyces sp. NBC_00272 TaxID=2975698 RepID=UPI002E27ADEE|nr:hypothetical protein [Streptomyces sp. NBC_00272]
MASDYEYDAYLAFVPEDAVSGMGIAHDLPAYVRTFSEMWETTWISLVEGMSRCRSFVLIASPHSASSPLVRRQVEYWRENRDMNSFHIVHVFGEIRWDPVRGDLDWERTDALPDSLAGAFSERPKVVLHIDAPSDPEDMPRMAVALAGRPRKSWERALDSTRRSADRVGQWRPRTLLCVLLMSLLAIAWVSSRSLLGSYQASGLGPSDAPAAVASIVSIGTVVGVLIGGTLSGLAKLIQARGQKDADLVRANAEMVRAQADMIRAKAGLPPTESPAQGALAAPGAEAEIPEPPAS